ERATKLDPTDGRAELRYRTECVRQGRHDLAGVKVGDIVQIEEVESPWVRGTWEGIVLRKFDANDKYVRPTHPAELNFRVKPSPAYMAQGLYLTREDKVSCKIPVTPGSPPPSTEVPAS